MPAASPDPAQSTIELGLAKARLELMLDSVEACYFVSAVSGVADCSVVNSTWPGWFKYFWILRAFLRQHVCCAMINTIFVKAKINGFPDPSTPIEFTHSCSLKIAIL